MRKTKVSQENYFIDFLRFVFSLIIMCYHSWVFAGEYGNGLFNFGNLGVDFYFIVTGYLMINSINKKSKKREDVYTSTFDYILNKIRRLLPSLIITFLIGYILVFGKNCLDLRNLFYNNVLGEFLQLGILGYEMPINTSWWYISAMLVVLSVLYPLAAKNKEKYSNYIAPLILIITLGIVKSLNININDPVPITFIFRNGLYKAIIFIILGNISYNISNSIKKIKMSKKQTIATTITEIIIYIFLIMNMHFGYVQTILFAILFTINIALTFSNQSLTSKVFNSPIYKKLGNFGFYIYLTNVSVRTFLMRHKLLSYGKMLLIFTLTTLIVSAIAYVIVEVIYPKIKEKILKKS